MSKATEGRKNSLFFMSTVERTRRTKPETEVHSRHQSTVDIVESPLLKVFQNYLGKPWPGASLAKIVISQVPFQPLISCTDVIASMVKRARRRVNVKR